MKLINFGNTAINVDYIVSISKDELDTFYYSNPYIVKIKYCFKGNTYNKKVCFTSSKRRDEFYNYIIKQVNET